VAAEAPGGSAGLVLGAGQVFDVELEAVEHVEQVVGKVDVGLVHLVDEHHLGLALADGVAEGLQVDIRMHLAGGAVGRVLGVLEAAQGVEAVEQILGLAGALDRHHREADAQLFGDGAGQAGLAAAGLTFHQQRPAQADGQIDDGGSVGGGHIVGGARAGELGVGGSVGHGEGPQRARLQKPCRFSRL
jgi:hypothetical protein